MKPHRIADRSARRPRVISLTPTAVSRDSRTLKAATAYGRFGFESIVIEGVASTGDFSGLPITLRAVEPADGGISRRALRGALAKPRGWLANLTMFGGFLAFYGYTYWLKPLRHMRPATLYHLHSYEYYPLVALWCALFGGRYVYDAHDFYSGIQNEAEISRLQRRWIRPFQGWLEARCVAGAAACLSVSAGNASLIEARFGRRAIVVRNCHDFRLDRTPRRSLREVTGLSQEVFLVASLGQWKPGQATVEAIEALAQLPHRVHLAFVGGGYDWVRPLAEQRGLAGRVHLPGAVPADELVLFIASADAALVHYQPRSANYETALPNGFFQALAAGLPLVYAALPELGAVARSYGVGIAVEGCSPEALADGLRSLIEDGSERERQREAARRFSADVNFAAEERILSGIISDLADLRAGVTSCAE